MSKENKIPIEEKKDYVERIEKKAKDENISLKLACEKLNMRYYQYQDYKRDARYAEAKKIIENNNKENSKQEKTQNNIAAPYKELVLKVTNEVYGELQKKADLYLIPIEHIGQICLTDVVNKRLTNANKKEGA